MKSNKGGTLKFKVSENHRQVQGEGNPPKIIKGGTLKMKTMENLRTKNEQNNIKRGEKRKVSSISAFFEEKQQISKATPPRPTPNAPFKIPKPPPKTSPTEKQNIQEKQQHHPTKQETQREPQIKQQTQQGARPKTKTQQSENNIINNKLEKTRITHKSGKQHQKPVNVREITTYFNKKTENSNTTTTNPTGEKQQQQHETTKLNNKKPNKKHLKVGQSPDIKSFLAQKKLEIGARKSMKVGNNSTTTTLNNKISPVNNTLHGGKLSDKELQHSWDKGDTALQRDFVNLPNIKSELPELPDRIRSNNNNT